MRIIQLSDVHVWRYSYNPLHLFNKRVIGTASLLAGRARRFRLERLDSVVARVRDLAADHILITGDLTTTALPAEFQDARDALADLLNDPNRVTVIPGNHDRYTDGSVRNRQFEKYFGMFAPSEVFPGSAASTPTPASSASIPPEPTSRPEDSCPRRNWRRPEPCSTSRRTPLEG